MVVVKCPVMSVVETSYTLLTNLVVKVRVAACTHLDPLVARSIWRSSKIT